MSSMRYGANRFAKGEPPVTVSETNDFGADDIQVGAEIRLAYERDAFVLMAS